MVEPFWKISREKNFQKTAKVSDLKVYIDQLTNVFGIVEDGHFDISRLPSQEQSKDEKESFIAIHCNSEMELVFAAAFVVEEWIDDINIRVNLKNSR